MSGYGDLHDQVTIVSIDGVAETTSVQELADETNKSFDTVQDILGNLHGKTTTDKEIKSTSIAAELGDIQKFSTELPILIEFSDYVQTFVGSDPAITKEFTLDLIPSGDITIVTSPISSFIRKDNIQELDNSTDYTLVGRSLIFHTPPIGTFTATYTGSYPGYSNLTEGYKPNVYPSPELIIDTSASRPVITQVNSTRYRLTFTQVNKNNDLEEFGGNLELTFNPVIDAYVGTSNAVPPDYVSIWLKTDDPGSTYRKVDTTAIYIDSSTEVEFVTTESINTSTDNIILVLSNVSIGEALKATIDLLRKHNHDRSGEIAPISHSNLKNLLPPTSEKNVVYAGSTIPGNDHPQYLHREGWKDGDIGTYNNIMVGDLIIGSSDQDSYHNNINENSFILGFGSKVDGPALNYNKDNQSLFLFGPQNGLKIQSASTTFSQEKPSFGLNINGHEFFTWKEDYDFNGTLLSNSMLSIGAIDSVVRISDISGENLGDLIARRITSSINLPDDGKITIDYVSLVKTDIVGNNGILVKAELGAPSPLLVDFNVKAEFIESAHTLANIETANIYTAINIAQDANIGFGDTASQANNFAEFSATENSEKSLLIKTEKPVKLISTGRRTGLAIGGQTVTDEYSNIYTAAPTGGESSSTITDTYFELHKGALYLLKTTNQTLNYNGDTYTWVDNTSSLHSWPRADLYAGNAEFINLTISQATNGQTTGIDFGNNNKIYVTGTGTNCPAGWMVFASINGAVFVDGSADTIDCSSLNYADVTAGNINSFGSVVASTDISAGNNIRAANYLYSKLLEVTGDSILGGAVRIKSKLNVESDFYTLGDATINGNISTSGSAQIGNTLDVNVLNVNGSAEFNEIAKFNSQVISDSDFIINGSTTISGGLTVKTSSDFETLHAQDASIDSLTVNSEFIAKTSAQIKGNLDLDGSLTVVHGITSEAAITAAGPLSGDSLNINRTSVFGGLSSFGDGVTISGDLFLNNSGKQLIVTGPSNFTGKSTFSNGIAVNSASTLGPITVSGEAEFKAELSAQTINVKGIECDGPISAPEANGSLQIGGVAIFDNIVQIRNGKLTGVNAEFSSDVTVNGVLTTENLTIRSDLTAISGFFTNIEVAGYIKQTSSTQDVTISGPLNVTSVATFTNVLKVGSANPVSISDNAIEVGPSSNRGTVITGRIVSESVENSETIRSKSIEITDTTRTESILINNNLEMTGDGIVSFNNQRLRNVGSPVESQDAVTLGYLNGLNQSTPTSDILTGAPTLSGLTPGKKYLISIYGICHNRGTGDDTLGQHMIREGSSVSSGAILASTPSERIDWPDGNVPVSVTFIIDGPPTGTVTGVTDGDVPARTMYAVRLT